MNENTLWTRTKVTLHHDGWEVALLVGVSKVMVVWGLDFEAANKIDEEWNAAINPHYRNKEVERWV